MSRRRGEVLPLVKFATKSRLPDTVKVYEASVETSVPPSVQFVKV